MTISLYEEEKSNLMLFIEVLFANHGKNFKSLITLGK